MKDGICLDSVHGRLTDPPLWHIDDPLDRQVVISIVHHLKIGHQIFDFLPIIETDAPDDGVRNRPLLKLLLKNTGLGVGPVQNRHILIRHSPHGKKINIRNYALRLIILRIVLLKMYQLSRHIFCPELLLLPALVKSIKIINYIFNL